MNASASEERGLMAGGGNGQVNMETTELYRKQGFGATRIGFGLRPALLVVDMQHDFVDPESPSTCSPIAQERLPDFQRLLAAARESRIPVFYSQGLVAPDLADVGLWKGRAHRTGKSQIEGTRGAEIVPELAPRPNEHIVRKRRPSVFFATDFDVFLRGLQIDTLIVTGSSMSGCVRATVVDGFSRDYRVMVVRECVVDRTAELIDRNLFDVDAKYADAVSLDETLVYLASLAVSPRATAAIA
jgi:nicotinamidase-related amidase